VSSRIRENSGVFLVEAPNSHESGYKETSHFPRAKYQKQFAENEQSLLRQVA